MSERKTSKREELEQEIERLKAVIDEKEQDLKIASVLLNERNRTIQYLSKALEIMGNMTESNKMSAVMSLSQLAKGEKDDVDTEDQGQ